MINIPFNFQPESVSVVTSSTVLTSGKYAYVVANVENGGSFTINGSTALSSSDSIAAVSAVSNKVSNSNGTLLTVSSGYRFEGTYKINGACEIEVGGEVMSGASNEGEIKAGSGEVISTDGVGTGDSVILAGFQIREHQGEVNATQGFWLPEGTTIAGSGAWRATIQYFNNIS